MNVNDNQQPREGTIRQMSVHENGCLLACTVGDSQASSISYLFTIIF